VWTYAVVEIYFYWYAYKPTAEPKRNELLIRLNQIKGVSIPPDAINKRPSIPLSVLKDKAALRQFLECFDWFIAELKKPKV
jgi:hypothetical protein